MHAAFAAEHTTDSRGVRTVSGARVGGIGFLRINSVLGRPYAVEPSSRKSTTIAARPFSGAAERGLRRTAAAREHAQSALPDENRLGGDAMLQERSASTACM